MLLSLLNINPSDVPNESVEIIFKRMCMKC